VQQYRGAIQNRPTTTANRPPPKPPSQAKSPQTFNSCINSQLQARAQAKPTMTVPVQSRKQPDVAASHSLLTISLNSNDNFLNGMVIPVAFQQRALLAGDDVFYQPQGRAIERNQPSGSVQQCSGISHVFSSCNAVTVSALSASQKAAEVLETLASSNTSPKVGGGLLRDICVSNEIQIFRDNLLRLGLT